MKRGDIYWADLEPVRADEANKIRPIIVVSCSGINETTNELGRGIIIVLPITSNIDKIYDFQVFLPSIASGLTLDSKIQVEQIRSTSISRIDKKLIGKVPTYIMKEVDNKLKLLLDL